MWSWGMCVYEPCNKKRKLTIIITQGGMWWWIKLGPTISVKVGTWAAAASTSRLSESMVCTFVQSLLVGGCIFGRARSTLSSFPIVRILFISAHFLPDTLWTQGQQQNRFCFLICTVPGQGIFCWKPKLKTINIFFQRAWNVVFICVFVFVFVFGLYLYLDYTHICFPRVWNVDYTAGGRWGGKNRWSRLWFHRRHFSAGWLCSGLAVWDILEGVVFHQAKYGVQR